MPHLEVNDVCARYGKVEVLRGISLSVQKGEVVALVGPSGSGKSTVLRVLLGLLVPHAGAVSVADTPVNFKSGSSIRAVRDRMAVVFQQYNLFQNMTVMGNICLAPVRIKGRKRREVEAEARALLARVGLADKADAYPDALSGGQQQRVAIARALALQPDILLLDEITSALDPELVGEVLSVIHDLAKEGMTMVIVSHEMGFVRQVADTVVMMDGGVVVETGPPAALFDHPKTERARDFFARILPH
ncbi:MAG: amino acid ABC transporter ATP-binding protein [Pseudomonadota bacterium]